MSLRNSTSCLPTLPIAAAGAGLPGPGGRPGHPLLHLTDAILFQFIRLSFLQVRGSLGQAGDLATETAALLSMEQVHDDDQFTPEASSGPHFQRRMAHTICCMAHTAFVWKWAMLIGLVRALPCTADCATDSCRRCWRACRPHPGPSARKSWPSGATSGVLVCARLARRCCRPPQRLACRQHCMFTLSACGHVASCWCQIFVSHPCVAPAVIAAASPHYKPCRPCWSVCFLLLAGRRVCSASIRPRLATWMTHCRVSGGGARWWCEVVVLGGERW